MLDTVVEFFLGEPPEGLEAIFYIFRCAIGLLVFDMILDVFRFVRRLIPGRG